MLTSCYPIPRSQVGPLILYVGFTRIDDITAEHTTTMRCIRVTEKKVKQLPPLSVLTSVAQRAYGLNNFLLVGIDITEYEMCDICRSSLMRAQRQADMKC